jgi:hypothetical protein
MNTEYDLSDRFVIGNLCKKKHEYKNSGGSLRYSSNNQCIECRGILEPGKRKSKRGGTSTEAFFKNVDKNGPYQENLDSNCWDWTGGTDRKGYGRFRMDGFSASHRFSYWIHNEKQLPDDLLVCHKCDRPSCVNPEHLFLGTHKDNLVDMAEKKRGCHGEKSIEAKITEADVYEIRRLYEAGKFTQLELGEIYDLNQATISSIVNGRSWKHLDLGAIKRPFKKLGGSKHHDAKMTEESVKEMRHLYESDPKTWTQANLMRKYGISQSVTSSILLRKTWKHVS